MKISFPYILHLADNALVLAQRNAEWTGHGPVLEQDIAITNISLDLLGQARNFFQHAAAQWPKLHEAGQGEAAQLLPEPWKSFNRELQEDDLAMLRNENQYLNLLITELPRGDWAVTVMRQFFFSAFQQLLYRELMRADDDQVRAIAEKSLKEVDYHVRWSGEWVIRLGDGTEQSRNRIETALDTLWPFTGEMFLPADFESVDVQALKEPWLQRVKAVFEEAGLEVPPSSWAQQGGKKGIHTEHMGYLLTELQYLQRTYPNSVW